MPSGTSTSTPGRWVCGCKKTVNQDEPSVYHLFYADEEGSPGADMTFFEFPGARSAGPAGG